MTALVHTLRDLPTRMIGLTVHVDEVEWLSGSIRRIRVAGPALVGRRLPVAGKVKVRVAPGVLRSYTPARRDEAAGWFDLIAHVHGGGAGSAWAAAATPGDAVVVVGPKQSFVVPSALSWALVLGDETTIGLWAAIQQARPTARLSGAVELDAGDAEALAGLGLAAVDAVHRGDVRGEGLHDWLSRAALPVGPGAVFISGHHRSAVGLQAAVQVAVEAADRRDVEVVRKSYWGDGRKARQRSGRRLDAPRT